MSFNMASSAPALLVLVAELSSIKQFLGEGIINWQGWRFLRLIFFEKGQGR
jgi:hypothetical protein